MNPVAELVRTFQNLVAQVPELVQPLIVALAGAVPFIDGEGAGPIGVIGGIHPLAAGIAAAIGNFLAVLGIVLFSSRVRAAAVDRRAERGTSVPAKPESKGRQRFRGFLVRFGVPGASILGPLAIPSHFTSAMLVAAGTPRAWVLLWQAISIVLWTGLTTAAAWLAVGALVG